METMHRCGLLGGARPIGGSKRKSAAAKARKAKAKRWNPISVGLHPYDPDCVLCHAAECTTCAAELTEYVQDMCSIDKCSCSEVHPMPFDVFADFYMS